MTSRGAARVGTGRAALNLTELFLIIWQRTSYVLVFCFYCSSCLVRLLELTNYPLEVT